MEWTELNSSRRKDIVANLIAILEHVPDAALTALETALSRNEEISALNLKRITGLSGLQLEILNMLTHSFKNDPKLLLLCLEVARGAWQSSGKDRELIDLTYTGPVQFSVSARSTGSVIEEMIKNAKNNVIIIGYRITEHAHEVAELLSGCVERGIRLTLVIDSDEENKDVLNAIWRGLKRPTIYTRIPRKDDTYFKIHAKCIVVDSQDILVTSANLTWHGISNNLEIGIRLRGKTAAIVEKLIRELITTGYLEKMQ